ncbi:hypothetical protein CFC21_022737 [Triticum aestivum]|uniref:C3H1-type domain-containing protein n=2 Tax=Triticum aestivum TaxID=4565 RepID=A0A9R1ECA4_WHEAT|nr:uncharacterized protein LOC123041083 [Triticum aestivum]KAF7007848.1 hypothetical protein CFC21_022737 [Triticum aestivum]
MPTTATGNAELRRLGRRLPSPLSLRRLPPHRRRRRARTSGPSGGLSSTRPNAARGFLSHALGVPDRPRPRPNAANSRLPTASFQRRKLAGVIYTASASPSSSSPSSSPFPEREACAGIIYSPLPRCAEPFLEWRKTRKQKMAWMSDQPCRSYIIDGSCKYGSDCLFSHGLDLFGRIEMQIRALLHVPDVYQVPVEHLPWSRPELGIMLRQVGWDGTLGHLMSLLERLHTICVVYNSYGYYAILLENVSHYLGYLPYNPNVMDADSEAHQIYINFSAQSIEICTEENVRIYFSHYGEVLSVYIPHEMAYGFVRFRYPETVRLLLSNWNPQVPHFIFGAGLYVGPYISYNRRYPAVNHGLNDPDGGLEHMPNAAGGVAGQVPGVPDGNAAQQDMNPAGNHGPNVPDAGPGHVPNALGVLPDEVLGVPVGDAAQPDMNPAGNGVAGQVPVVPDGGAAQEDMDEIAAALPDVDCFYQAT